MRKEITRNIVLWSVTEIHDQRNIQEYSVFPDFYNTYVLLWSLNKCWHSAEIKNNWFEYNDVSNQQDATIFSFINLFNSALYVSGDKFTRPHEHFLTVYTAFGAIHLSAAVSVHCTNSYIYSQKVLLRMGEFVARNM